MKFYGENAVDKSRQRRRRDKFKNAAPELAALASVLFVLRAVHVQSPLLYCVFDC
jgi:hypothetical protein